MSDFPSENYVEDEKSLLSADLSPFPQEIAKEIRALREKAEEMMLNASSKGDIETMIQLKEMGVNNLVHASYEAAKGGHYKAVVLCKDWGVRAFGGIMSEAAQNGHEEIIYACRKWMDEYNFDITGLTFGIVAYKACLLYTSPSPRDKRQSRMPSSA